MGWGILVGLVSGLAFAAGVLAGAYLARAAMSKGMEEASTKWREHQDRVEYRLARYVEHTAVIAEAAKMWMAKEGSR